MIYEKIKIKKLAISNHVSINQIEKDLGFSSSTISKWNNSNPTSIKLKQVADYFGVSMEYLLEREKQEV
ncbi:helix-turn-helix domain-containing protein [Enterococcus faecalis]|uniref:helix-turn-helix domain-containing protein n=1 Tax=Enterococcus faecalis TaxID=1351 RepID=UPI002453008C|nr:helix-turn-helix transcriptional regulator [Enterococcus faecalis]WGL02422.1 helix-turn-helix domain-containing protein [Enterococcus faecalis]